MDTSAEYREMCRKATELQAHFDCNFDESCGRVGSFRCEETKLDYWMPSQEQLQGLLSQRMEVLIRLFNKYTTPMGIIKVKEAISEKAKEQFKEEWRRWVSESHKHPLILSNDTTLEWFYFPKLDSMEKLWLTIVMREKANKTWDITTQGWVSLKKEESIIEEEQLGHA